jgi:hypothetical protein
VEHFDVLLNVPRLWVAEPHDDLEELLALSSGFADGSRAKSLEVPADAVLLIDAKPIRCSEKLLEEVNCIDRRDITRLLLLPPYATDAYAVWWPFRHAHGLESDRQDAPRLLLPEQYEPPLILPFLLGPAFRHGRKVADNLQRRLLLVGTISRKSTGGLSQCAGADELWGSGWRVLQRGEA